MKANVALGLDFGETAIRIAVIDAKKSKPQLLKMQRIVEPPVAISDLGLKIRQVLDDAGIRERRCVAVLQDPDAMLRALPMTNIPRREMEAVAALEAERVFGEGHGWSQLASTAIGEKFPVGLARRQKITRLREILRAAKMNLIALDHASLAYRRIFPHADAVVDVGHTLTRFYAMRGGLPWSTSFEGGGSHITTAIARAYNVDQRTAQRRIIDRGRAAGAEAEIDRIVDGISRAIRSARANEHRDVETMLLVGNSSRLPELLQKIERETGCLVELASRCSVNSGSYDSDVTAVALPDWALAIAAASWSFPQEATT